MEKSRFIAVLGVALLVAMAGCTQLITSEEASFEANEGGVDGAEEAGFELDSSEYHNITRTVEAAGQEREITVSNYVETYLNKPDDNSSEAAFAVITSPQVKIAGQAVNPVGDWSHSKILEEFGGELDGYGTITDLEEEDTETMEILDTETDVTTFNATVESDDGSERPVTVTVTSVKHDDDYVIAVGAHDVGDTANEDAI